MTERIDGVPEADYVEQHTPAFPADAAYPDADAYPDKDVLADTPLEADSELTPLTTGDSNWNADEGDLIEQSIPVPMDDDYETEDAGD
ncbi:hypothetical protein OHB26_14500 [Nocardia sp. NBC_01503]|uniref:hypothetical protein n=1 Tax=Nocardia sp. NBC_01503 TaxID=2975997 RepID=UPI002E7B6C65|nr:hypothetical protein [Nocardia sp. NBC_01503]WTL35294.1 hypothetical protein OHB26_14500 [Nocardia sp. NBC_01503]